MITRSEIEIHDNSGMFSIISAFPEQLKQAFDIGINIALKNEYPGINNIIITGLGGSAIGGDLIRSCLQYEINIPIQVNRNYYLPAYAGKKYTCYRFQLFRRYRRNYIGI